MATPTTRYPPRPVVDRRELPPGPAELPIIGQSLRYLRDPIGFMQEAATYGDLVTMSVKPALLLLVNHPDLIRDIVVTYHQRVGRGPNADVLKYAMGDGLVTAGPEDHLQQRRLMQPQFHRGRIDGYGAVMQEYAAHHQRSWNDGQRVDMAQEMGGLTLRIVVKTLFGLELPDDVRRIGEAFELINNYLVARVNQPPRLRRLLHRLPMPYTVRFRRARASLDEIIFGLINQRRDTSESNDDLLSLLLEAQLEDDDGNGKPLTDQQVRDQTITMFAAGHETTAVCLTWTWYLLAMNQHIQSRFHAELDEVIGGRQPTLSDLPNLKFADRVLTESLRLYPPIWFWSRMAFQPFVLGGYEIPPGALLAAPQLVVQRDPRWFQDPLEFHPDRWTDEFRNSLPRYAYYPFGGGPRQCIGEGFAMMEAKLILATLGQHWRVIPDLRHKSEMLPLISLRPKGGMPIYLERRG
jgi:cytochrome P450